MKILICILLSFSISAKDYTVVFYNVENLFDEVHDQGKNDFEYLPKSYPSKKAECNKISYKRYRDKCLRSDWTKKKVEMKLIQIKRVIDSFKKLPDIIGLCEIENEKVVKRLADILGYKIISVSNSPDKRGIDLALMVSPDSGLTIESHKDHLLEGDYFKKKPTRVILENTLKTKKGKLFKVYVNHWPSLGNPTSTRIVAAKKLKELMVKDQSMKLPAMAIGDFNTIDENYPHPFRDILTKESQIFEAHELFMKSKTIKRKMKKAMALGTYYYPPKMTWNRLDRIFLNSAFLDGNLKSEIESYKINNFRFITSIYEYTDKRSPLYGSRVTGIPKKYDHGAKTLKKAGFSDHFPISIKIQEK
ncbi:hypothetical protein OAT67_04375 [Bacteriovoracaceae bacterium]|nr:hypothetical protein [Bacteriovoracaceae bacterium]|tara:strand:+ start:105582 stop:106664 length:1083 start_codon:yes stop_codon:yes gene_type:complete